LMLSFTCVAPDATTASNITRELNDYFTVSQMGELVPPWSPAAMKEDFAAAQAARRTWSQIQHTVTAAWTNTDSRDLLKQANDATRRGDLIEADRLRRLQAAHTKEAQTNIYRKLAQEGVDAELLELHQQLAALSYTNGLERSVLQRRVANRLGRVDAGNNSAAPNYAASYGSVYPAKLMLRINFVSFKDGTTGWPAFTDWLCTRGCKDIRYRIYPGNSYLDELDDER
jgi:hypothetical protein